MAGINLLGVLAEHRRSNGTIQTDYAVYGTDGASPIILARAEGGRILIAEKTVKVIGQMNGTFEMQGRVYDKDGLCPAIRTFQGGGLQPKIVDDGSYEFLLEEAKKYRIRKLTPHECWRLMGFADEDFDRAAYKTNKFYLEGGIEKCGANLRIVPEKQRLSDTETYVLCTISGLQDTEILRTIKKSSAEKQENGKMQNVGFAIERLEKTERLDYATNTTKCITFMGMQCTLTEEKDQRATVIIVQGQKDKENTEKCMKITTESNLKLSKLYIILILTERIIKSQIFGSTTLRANISGYTQITEDCKNNTVLKILNLGMETISQNVSSSQLYKQAGNAIVKQVLMALFSQLNIKGVKPWNERKET